MTAEQEGIISDIANIIIHVTGFLKKDQRTMGLAYFRKMKREMRRDLNRAMDQLDDLKDFLQDDRDGFTDADRDIIATMNADISKRMQELIMLRYKP